MSNALKELFGNIATAIRDKTGSEETMTPAEFPEKIGEISVNTCDTVETTVDLDFSEGDMVVAPESGQLFEEVNIPKPENLVPENIAEGVDIAGIIGALQAGSNVKVTGGDVKLTSGAANTITHNLGVLPDIIAVYTGTVRTNPSKLYLMLIAGISNNFRAKISGDAGVYWGSVPTIAYVGYNTSGQKVGQFYTKQYIENTSSTYYLYGADDKIFKVGSSSVEFTESTEYSWFAIAGLT